MAETRGGNLFLDPIVYFRITAWLLGLVILLGIISATAPHERTDRQFLSFLGLQFTWTHNILNVVFAAASTLFGYAALQPRLVKTMAIVFGIVYLALGVMGFFILNSPDDLTILSLTITLNVIHLLLGGWALACGLLGDA